MTALRRDPATGAWVIVAPGRRLRPREGADGGPESCPFCAGREAETPGDLLRVPGPVGQGWRVRVVPNKFAVLSPDGEAFERMEGPMFREVGAAGHHEGRARDEALRRLLPLRLRGALRERRPYYLWHLQILPRVATLAGFELGSGIPINTVAPEEAAGRLRDALPE